MDWSRRGPGANVPLAAIMKDIISVPVMTVAIGRGLREKILREGKADWSGWTGVFFADPITRIGVRRRLEEYSPCTHCNNCNKGTKNAHCRINAFSDGSNMKLRELRQKKGVGGRRRTGGSKQPESHHERAWCDPLWEGALPGGSLPLAVDGKRRWNRRPSGFYRYFKDSFKRTGCPKSTFPGSLLSDIDKIKPDVVVLALGGIPTLPDVPGINTASSQKALTFMGFCDFL